MTEINKYHFKEVYGLRAVAVSFVVLYHSGFGVFSGGHIGLDIFFVVSGFIITSSIEGSLLRSSFSLFEFYGRRIRRIYPALLVMMVCTIPFGWKLIMPEDFNLYNLGLIGAVTGVANFLYYFRVSYFDAQSDFRPILHTWSLAVELQFYLIFPIIYIYARKVFGKALRFTLLVATLFLAVISLYVATSHHQFGLYMLPTRLFELLAGSYVYLLKRDSVARSSFTIGFRSDSTYAVVGFLCLIGAFLFSDASPPVPGIFTCISTVGTTLLLLNASKNDKIFSFLTCSPIVYIGAISYSLYLIHQPILVFPRLFVNHELDFLWVFFLIFLALAVSVVFYEYIEQPFRSVHRVPNRSFYSILVVSILFIYGVAYIGLSPDGLRSRFDEADLGRLRSLYEYPHGPLHDSECDRRYPVFSGISACRVSSNAEPDVLLLGDSHSHHYYESIVRKFPDHVILNLGSWSCFPVPSAKHFRTRDCKENFSNLIEFLKKDGSKIKYVVLSGYWNYLQAGGFAVKNGYFKMPARMRHSEFKKFEENFDLLIEVIKKNKSKVILFKDIPDLNFSPISCVNLSPVRAGYFEACNMSRADYDSRTREYDVGLRKLLMAHPEVVVYDPVSLFCDYAVCRGKLNGSLAYYDSDHLSVFGAELVMEDFFFKVGLH